MSNEPVVGAMTENLWMNVSIVEHTHEPSYDDVFQTDHPFVYSNAAGDAFFADETGDLHGPFFDVDTAVLELEMYCEWLNHEDKPYG